MMEVYVVVVEPMDTNTYVHDVYASKDRAQSEAAELREFESNAAASVKPFEVDVPTFTKTLQPANHDGTRKVTYPHYLKVDGRVPEIGDRVTFAALDVETRED